MTQAAPPATHPDDEFHPPLDDDPYRTETCWFTFTVPERRLSGQLYPFFRPNLGVVAAAAYFWDDQGDQPGHYQGTIRLRGETFSVDAYGFRDRSWGKRSQFGRGSVPKGAACGGYSYATASPAAARNFFRPFLGFRG